mmetsp:Transcript_22266/g.39932  ORF Transcript_22266/g.39932 Transcript_22266/m.39932 type:complete len:87 (+) Transcript_22266:136-396(+)
MALPWAVASIPHPPSAIPHPPSRSNKQQATTQTLIHSRSPSVDVQPAALPTDQQQMAAGPIEGLAQISFSGPGGGGKAGCGPRRRA